VVRLIEPITALPEDQVKKMYEPQCALRNEDCSGALEDDHAVDKAPRRKRSNKHCAAITTAVRRDGIVFLWPT
jgi:hypothetical protein